MLRTSVCLHISLTPALFPCNKKLKGKKKKKNKEEERAAPAGPFLELLVSAPGQSLPLRCKSLSDCKLAIDSHLSFAGANSSRVALGKDTEAGKNTKYSPELQNST